MYCTSERSTCKAFARRVKVNSQIRLKQCPSQKVNRGVAVLPFMSNVLVRISSYEE